MGTESCGPKSPGCQAPMRCAHAMCPRDAPLYQHQRESQAGPCQRIGYQGLQGPSQAPSGPVLNQRLAVWVERLEAWGPIAPGKAPELRAIAVAHSRSIELIAIAIAVPSASGQRIPQKPQGKNLCTSPCTARRKERIQIHPGSIQASRSVHSSALA